MAGSLNKVTLIGNLGRDPEIRSTNEGKELANFSIATSESWKDKATGEKREKTEWHRVVVFSEGLVRVVKNYVKKGTKLYIEGQLQTRKWVDNENKERYTTEIVLQSFNSTLILLDSRGTDAGTNLTRGESISDVQRQTGSSPAQSAQNFEKSEIEDEIPF